MHQVIGIFCIVTLLFQSIASAEPIILGSFYIPGLVVNETEGTFIKIRTYAKNSILFYNIFYLK